MTGHSTEILPKPHRIATVVTKPYSEPELLKAVETVLGKVSAQDVIGDSGGTRLDAASG